MKLKRVLISIIIMLNITACSTPPKLICELGDIPPPPRKIENVRVALVLGGGGARGAAHLGVLEVLEQHNIPIDLIVGTSAGSVVGAMYADYKDCRLLYDQLIRLRKWDLLDLSISDSLLFFSQLKGPVQGYYLEEFIAKNMTVNNVEDLKIPFIAVATDITNNKAYTFASGPIAIAVHASSAIPPVFTPVKAYGRILVDGGVIEAVPVQIAKNYNPKVVIAVDISTNGGDFKINNMADVVSKSMSISYYTMSQMQSAKADVVIHPNLSEYGTFDDCDNYKVYNLGKNAALRKLPEIIAELRRKKIMN
jgi:NTE family protein